MNEPSAFIYKTPYIGTVGIAIVYGTRPEAIKLGPVVAELRTLGISPQLISTGQHWDLLRGTPAETDLKDSLSLGIPGKPDPLKWVTLAQPVIWGALGTLEPYPPEYPWTVVVQGDTASALAGARAAHEGKYPLAHIEGGVRSHNMEEPWPEESFRREITQLATWHYAPTSTAFANLIAEGVPENRIRLTGNPVVSAMQRYANARLKPAGNHIILTMHRREWLQSVNLPEFLGEVTHACLDHPQLDIIWPVHPAVRAQWPSDWSEPPNLRLREPLEYRAMLQLLSTALGLATDSGGLVEEATTLGIPTAILRNSNDRSEAVETGIARTWKPPCVHGAITWLSTSPLPRKPSPVYGDTESASRIAHHLSTL